jgi:hypothetical protein
VQSISSISWRLNEEREDSETKFISSEQEHNRTMSSSDVDDRTQHEIYAHPFLRSVMAGVTSFMCSISAYFSLLTYIIIS